jgi:hypothetical protein
LSSLPLKWERPLATALPQASALPLARLRWLVLADLSCRDWLWLAGCCWAWSINSIISEIGGPFLILGPKIVTCIMRIPPYYLMRILPSKYTEVKFSDSPLAGLPVAALPLVSGSAPTSSSAPTSGSAPTNGSAHISGSGHTSSSAHTSSAPSGSSAAASGTFEYEWLSHSLTWAATK